MLLSVLWFKISMLFKYKFTGSNPSHNMPAEYICVCVCVFLKNDFIPCFFFS